MIAYVPTDVRMCNFGGDIENRAYWLPFVAGEHVQAVRLCAQPYRSLQGPIRLHARFLIASSHKGVVTERAE